MRRSIFDWQPPEHTVIEQLFGDAYRLGNSLDQRDVHFVARCTQCSTTSTERATRADALEEIDDHVCTPTTSKETAHDERPVSLF